MAEELDTRRSFLQKAGYGVTAAVLTQVPGHDPLPQRPRPSSLTHLPGSYEELFNLSDEQKTMLSAVVASGCDAVAYYKPGEESFVLDKQFDLYQRNDTVFDETVAFEATDRSEIARNDDRGQTWYRIPVRAPNGVAKGVIVLHASDTPYDKVDPDYVRDAKLRMAKHVIDEHADLFGASGNVLREREASHRSLPHKRQYFMTLVKDMFSTFTRANPIDPQTLPEVQFARDGFQLKAALRSATATSNSDQYPHVLGVTDIMAHAVERAINPNGQAPMINREQEELIVLLTLLHDVGKTQIPSYMMGRHDTDQEGKDFGTERNGSHPLFTAVSLAFYKQDALDTSLHHHGFRRYGDEEIAEMRRTNKVSPDFNRFTELQGKDITPDKLPPLSKIMRVADVMEAVTARPDLPIHEALKEMGAIGNVGEFRKMIRVGADGKYVVSPDTIDPDYLCFMLANGVFDAYGQQRTAESNGWISNSARNDSERRPLRGQPKYNPEKLAATKEEILKRFGWDNPEVRAEKEARIRAEIAADPLLLENPQRAQARPAVVVF